MLWGTLFSLFYISSATQLKTSEEWCNDDRNKGRLYPVSSQSDIKQTGIKYTNTNKINIKRCGSYILQISM